MEVFEPLTHVKGAFMIMLSSPPKDQTHWFIQALKRKKPDGTPAIFQVSFDLVCDECAKLPPEKWAFCNHLEVKNSRLKNKKKRQKNQEAQILDDEAFALENLGHVVSNRAAAFKEKYIDFLMDPKNYVTLIRTPSAFLMAIDFNAGGFNDSALTTGFRDDTGTYTICWQSNENTVDWDDVRLFVLNNIMDFWDQIGQYHNVPLVIAAESVSRWDAPVFKWLVDMKKGEEFRNVHFIVDGYKLKSKKVKKRKVAGVNLNNKRKKDFINNTNQAFAANKIRFYEKMGTTNSKGVKYIRNMNRNQLMTFVSYDESKKKSNTGKIGDKNDDLCITFQMFVYWWNLFMYNPTYQKQRVDFGIEDEEMV